jgi:hypothetical protein
MLSELITTLIPKQLSNQSIVGIDIANEGGVIF